MPALLNLDKKLMTFMLLFPMVLDMIIDFMPNKVLQFISTVLVLLWQLSACIALHKKTSNDNQIGYSRFYFVFAFLAFSFYYPMLNSNINLDKYVLHGHAFYSILVICSYGWVINFISSRLRELEKRRHIKSDGLITFALIFVLPVGIWWIQQRVQAMLKEA